MTLRLNGNTSGYVELDCQATGGNNTIQLPTSNGSANQFLKNGSTAGTLGWSSMVEDSSGRLLVGTSTGRNIADAAQAGIQYETTNFGGISITNNRTDGSGANLAFGKQRSGSVGGNTIVQNGDGLGAILFGGADGTDLETQGARIEAAVDGTPGANDMPGRLVFSTTADGASSPTERMRIRSNGEVRAEANFAGTSFNLKRSGVFSYADLGAVDYDPQAGAATSGLIVIYCRGNDGSGGTNGVSLSRGATSWAAYSDERAKTDLIPIDDGLNKIATLRAVTGRYLTDEAEVSRSFLIAQDVQKVLPEAVDANDPEQLNLRYAEVIPLLVSALKESKERIETLEQRLADAGIA